MPLAPLMRLDGAARMLCGLTEIADVLGGLAVSLLLWDGLSHTFLQDDDRSIYQIIGSAV